MGKGGKKNDTLDVSEEEEPDRGQWANPVEFILSCLGYAVGLGNVWRFPYLCYENGGGAFLIPYAIMLTFVGLPVFFIELSVGQYSASGPVTVWEASPIFRGVGIGMIIISFIGSIYYNMIIGWSLYYMFACFQKNLPWVGCTHDYNTEHCYSKEEATACEDANGTWYNSTCYEKSTVDSYPTYVAKCPNETEGCVFNWLTHNITKRVSASEEYFNHVVLNRRPDMDSQGEMQWELTLVLLLAWILCFLCVIKGIKSSGKVVYFTATFPYIILIILFFRGVTLPGARDGIEFYIIPDWDKLGTSKVWVDAAGQIFFSLSVGMGGLMTFASYNKFNNNVYRDTLIVTIGNCLTSFFAGFVIFSILGFMAHELETDVASVASSGSGLAFIAYPEVVARLAPAHLWAILFFFMLLMLGLDSQFAGLENIMTAIVDLVPSLRPKKTFVALALCVVMYLLGLTMCTQAGAYWLDLMGYYSSGWSLVLIGLAECTIFAWVYGGRKLLGNIEEMVGFKLYPHWWICWMFITPALILAILCFNFYEFTPLSYGDYLLPDWAQVLGWLMAVTSVAPIPIYALILFIMSYWDSDFDDLKWYQRLKKLSEPSDKWKPSIEKTYGSSANAPAIADKYKSTSHHENPAFAGSNDTLDSEQPPRYTQKF